jgi:hypothetical protein
MPPPHSDCTMCPWQCRACCTSPAAGNSTRCCVAAWYCFPQPAGVFVCLYWQVMAGIGAANYPEMGHKAYVVVRRYRSVFVVHTPLSCLACMRTAYPGLEMGILGFCLSRVFVFVSSERAMDREHDVEGGTDVLGRCHHCQGWAGTWVHLSTHPCFLFPPPALCALTSHARPPPTPTSLA